jgi:hypothetical protein
MGESYPQPYSFLFEMFANQGVFEATHLEPNSRVIMIVTVDLLIESEGKVTFRQPSSTKRRSIGVARTHSSHDRRSLKK